jgi:NAD(P)-dependent dehydrogenase (short-subunit alcohol dehydrogenase family)
VSSAPRRGWRVGRCPVCFPLMSADTGEGVFRPDLLAGRVAIVTGGGTGIGAGSGAPFMGHSGAAKAGVLNLTRTLAVEWGRHGIRVNALAPGLVEGTEGARRLAESIGIVDAYRRQVPLGRLVTVDDVAATVLFLASAAASQITGAEVTIDGGESLGGSFKGVGDALDRIS